MDGSMVGWMDGLMNGWMDGWINEWMDGWINIWMDEQNERISEIADSTDIFCLSCLSPLQAKVSNNINENQKKSFKKI